ncbi:hypothetical protein [Streptomyces sp. NPDC004008]
MSTDETPATTSARPGTLKPRLRALIKGDDEQLKAALDRLRTLTNEVTERGKLLEELGGDSPKLTRELRPRVVVFDECHSEKSAPKALATGLGCFGVSVPVLHKLIG